MAEQEGRKQRAPKRTTKPEKKEEREGETKQPVAVTAKVGTLKRKQQMRDFLEQMPKDNHDDLFAASPLQNRSTKVVGTTFTTPTSRKMNVFAFDKGALSAAGPLFQGEQGAQSDDNDDFYFST